MRDEQFVFFHLDAGQFLSQLLGIFNKKFRLANKRIENICQESRSVIANGTRVIATISKTLSSVKNILSKHFST